MVFRRRVAVGALVIGLIVGASLWWWQRARTAGPAAPASRPVVASTHRLDAARLRTEFARRGEAIAALRATHPGPVDGARPDALAGLVASLTEPRCILGPATLCDDVLDTVRACAAGDASACLAVGQYLADEPPRPMAARFFFVAACRLGDAVACARDQELGADQPPPVCADDPLRCAIWASRHDQQDGTMLDQACAAGVADACADAMMLAHAAATGGADLVRERGYLEAACQLGSPMMCAELGRRLSVDCPGPCDPAAHDADCAAPCFAPEPDVAATALEMACAAGFPKACVQ